MDQTERESIMKKTPRLIPIAIGDYIVYQLGPEKWQQNLHEQGGVVSFNRKVAYTSHGWYVPRNLIISAEHRNDKEVIRY